MLYVADEWLFSNCCHRLISEQETFEVIEKMRESRIIILKSVRETEVECKKLYFSGYKFKNLMIIPLHKYLVTKNIKFHNGVL